jgi:hypothetical protein
MSQQWRGVSAPFESDGVEFTTQELDVQASIIGCMSKWFKYVYLYSIYIFIQI